MIPVDWVVIGPALIVAVGALLALMIESFWPTRTWLAPAIVSALAVLAAGAELLRTDGPDRYTFALSAVVLAGTLYVLVAAFVMSYEQSMPPGEFHFLLLASAAGGLAMVSARDLVTLVVSLELLSLPSIALVGLRQGDREAIRSAWTFFLASVVSTAITLMGISLLYGISGSLSYTAIDDALRDTTMPPSVIAVAVVLTLVGLLFKLGAVPFHMWIPDAYRGSSVMVAGYLSAVSKAAALGALFVLLAIALPSAFDIWMPLMAVVATLTMTIGNIGALGQRDGVGLLAWSSIAQAGFLITPAVGLFAPDGLTAPVQYLAVYALANLVAFSVFAIVLRTRGSTSFDELAGLARVDLLLGGSLAFALLTLAGFPPAVIGLLTKYIVLRPVIEGHYYFLAVIMAVNVALGLAFYLRLFVRLFEAPVGELYVSPSPPYAVRLARIGVGLGVAGLIALSVWPDLLLQNLL
ncbi:MAG: NADH-quinone oxidoreductase subunit N [Aeromicrobium sp.]